MMYKNANELWIFSKQISVLHKFSVYGTHIFLFKSEIDVLLKCFYPIVADTHGHHYILPYNYLEITCIFPDVIFCMFESYMIFKVTWQWKCNFPNLSFIHTVTL